MFANLASINVNCTVS